MGAENPGASPSDPRRQRTQGFLRQLALAMELPFIPVMAVLIGGGLGYLIDRWAHTAPLFALVFGGLGFLAGVREILRRISETQKENNEKGEDSG